MEKVLLRSIALGALVASQLGLAPDRGPDVDTSTTESDVGAGYAALRGDRADAEAADADGLEPHSRSAVLETDHRSIRTDHGEAHPITAAATIELPERPEMLILEDVDTGSELAVRSRTDGVWSGWVELVATEDEAPDGGDGGEGELPDGVTAIGPIWTGPGTDAVEIATITGDRSFDVETLEVLATPSVGDDGPRSARAAAASDFIRPRGDWATSGMGWASYNGGCGSGPNYAKVTGAIIHHTAGTNGYTASEVPAIMRGIWYYHVQSRGWCDVAYNFFVDRFGRAWEARQGGIRRPVIGGHTFGFNTYTTGIAQLGNFGTTTAPSAMTTATQRLVGWKLGIHGIDPSGRTTYVNSASTTAGDGTPPGGKKTLSSVVGHRDLGSTSCPGSSTYSRLPGIRTSARRGAHTLALYEAFIGKEPSANNYERWATRADQVGLGGVADELAHTEAYAGIVIRELYRVVLGRSPDASGMRYWLQRLEDGMTVKQLSVYFYGSPEYYERSGNTDSSFVRALYRDLLHREADSSGHDYWVQRMARGASPAVVATSFIDSIESRRDRVTRLYRRFLGRKPDAGGLAYWADVLLRHDDLKLARFLALSDEFYDRQYS